MDTLFPEKESQYETVQSYIETPADKLYRILEFYDTYLLEDDQEEILYIFKEFSNPELIKIRIDEILDRNLFPQEGRDEIHEVINELKPRYIDSRSSSYFNKTSGYTLPSFDSDEDFLIEF